MWSQFYWLLCQFTAAHRVGDTAAHREGEYRDVARALLCSDYSLVPGDHSQPEYFRAGLVLLLGLCLVRSQLQTQGTAAIQYSPLTPHLCPANIEFI